MSTSATLYHGNCLDVMPTLGVGGVAMVFADLPYGATCNRWDVHLPLAEIWQSINRCLIASGPAILTATQPFASLLVASNIKRFRHDIIWHKSVATGFLNAKKSVLRAHEHILIFRQKGGTYNPQFTEGKPYRLQRYAAFSTNYGKQLEDTAIVSDGRRYPTSVQMFASDRRLHPTQKPIALMSWLIKTYTNPGDTVMDPVFGSATTGVACARLGRHFVGIERDETYFAMGRARLNDERAKLGLDPCEAITFNKS